MADKMPKNLKDRLWQRAGQFFANSNSALKPTECAIPILGLIPVHS